MHAFILKYKNFMIFIPVQPACIVQIHPMVTTHVRMHLKQYPTFLYSVQ